MKRTAPWKSFEMTLVTARELVPAPLLAVVADGERYQLIKLHALGRIDVEEFWGTAASVRRCLTTVALTKTAPRRPLPSAPFPARFETPGTDHGDAGLRFRAKCVRPSSCPTFAALGSAVPKSPQRLGLLEQHRGAHPAPRRSSQQCRAPSQCG
jgi:hypothetical protein